MIRKFLHWITGLFLKLTQHSKAPTDTLLDVKIGSLKYRLQDDFDELSFIIKVKMLRFFKYDIRRFLWNLGKYAIIVSIAWYAAIKPTVVYIWKPVPTQEVISSYPSDTSMNLRNFLLQLQYVESKNNYKANRPGSQYWGAYQMGTEARRLAGYGDISYDVWMKHPEIQEYAMLNWMKYNKRVLKKYINKYNGKIVGGILVTESGIIAMAHTGIGNVQNYLDSNGEIVGSDGLGTPCTNYLKLGGYTLNLEEVRLR